MLGGLANFARHPGAAEMIILALVRCMMPGGRRIHDHAANRVHDLSFGLGAAGGAITSRRRMLVGMVHVIALQSSIMQFDSCAP